MHNLSLLEEKYKQYISNLEYWLPDGLIEVNLALLHRFQLLHYNDPNFEEPKLTRYFHVIETYEKIMLVNEDFVIWIIPEKTDGVPVTICLIALNHLDTPSLELGFITSGVYNTSRLVLRILDKYLVEIQDTEDFLDRLGNAE